MSYSNTFLWDKCYLQSTRARVYDLLILSRVPTFLPSSTDILPQWPPVYADKIGLLVTEFSMNCMTSVEHVSKTQNGEKRETEILVIQTRLANTALSLHHRSLTGKYHENIRDLVLRILNKRYSEDSVPTQMFWTELRDYKESFRRTLIRIKF